VSPSGAYGSGWVVTPSDLEKIEGDAGRDIHPSVPTSLRFGSLSAPRARPGWTIVPTSRGPIDAAPAAMAASPPALSS